MKVAEALYHIRREQLFKHAEPAYDTFHQYCEERLQMSRQHAHRLVTAQKTKIRIDPILKELSLPPVETEYPLRRLKVVKKDEEIKGLLEEVATGEGNDKKIDLKKLYEKLDEKYPSQPRGTNRLSVTEENSHEGTEEDRGTIEDISQIEASSGSKFVKLENLEELRKLISTGDTKAALEILNSLL